MKNNILTIILVVFVGMIAFWYLTKTNDSSSNIVADAGTIQSGDAKYVYNLLQQMDKVTLDDTLFTGNVFKNLKDNTVSFSPQPSGRTNPFAPVGTDFVSNEGTSSAIR